MNPQSFINMV